MNFKDFKISIKNYKAIFFISSVFVLLLMVIGSFDAGNSGDEHYNHDHAGYVYDYIKTFGEDSSYINPAYPLQKYYGQSLDNIAYIINDEFGIEEYYKSRHVLNSISGWLLILFTALTASLLFGWKAGLFALFFMFFSPKILGHSWNNPKDIPFATTYIFTIYFLLSFIKSLPRINYWKLALIAVGIAASISIRIGGLIIIPYLFMFTGLYYLSRKDFYTKRGFQSALKVEGLIVIVSILGYFLGLILWPYGIEDPFNHPIEALKEMTNYEVGLNQLFGGQITISKELPWYYGLKYVLITSPIIVFLGAILFIPTLPFRRDSLKKYLFYFYLFFAFAFPIAYTIYQGSNLYGGWRHLLWTYSPLVVLSAGGFDYFLNKKNKYIKYGTLAVMIVLLWHPVRHTFKNHPHQYVYYNQLVGGVNGAYGEYEMDYYYHGLRAGAEWLIENELTEDSVTVTTNHSRIVDYYFRDYPQVTVEYNRFYEKSRHDWDYAIWTNTHITPNQLEEGFWPPKKTLHTVDVDTVPIAAVVKRISHEDYKGFQALDARKTEVAKGHFKAFLELYPESEEALEGMARAFMMRRNFDSTLVYADSSLQYNPRQLGSWLLKASAHNSKKEYKEALEASDEMVNISQSFAEGHFQKGLALRNLGNANEALKEFQIAINLKNDYYQAHMQMGDILLNYRKFDDAEKIYKKVLGFRENDFMASVRLAKCYHLAGNPQQAQQALQYAEKRSSNHFEVVKLKSRMELAQGDLNEAGQLLNRCRNINSNSDLEVLRAKYSLAINREEQAQNFLEKALELNKNNIEAKNLLRQVENNQKQEAKEEEPQQSIMFQKEKKQEGPKINLLNNSR